MPRILISLAIVSQLYASAATDMHQSFSARPTAQPSLTPPKDASSSAMPSKSSAVRGLLGAIGGPAALLDSVLQPVISKVTGGIIKTTESAVRTFTSKQKFCDTICGTGAKVPCRTKAGLAVCKLRCQQVIQVSGYELRIRYGEGEKGRPWDLKKCIGYAAGKGFESIEEKNARASKTNSFAIYGAADLNYALEMIAQQTALREFLGKSFTLDLTTNALVNGYLKEHPAEQGQFTSKEVYEALVPLVKEKIEMMDATLKDQMIELANVHPIEPKGSKKEPTRLEPDPRTKK